MISWFLMVIHSTVWGLQKQMLDLLVLALFLFYVMRSFEKYVQVWCPKPRVHIGSHLPGKVPLSGTFPGNPIVWTLAGTSPGDPTKLVGSGDERATLGS